MRDRLATIVVGLMINLAAMAVYFLIESASGKPLESAQRFLIFGIAAAVLASILGVVGYTTLNGYVSKAEERARISLELRTGIVAIFDNLPACEKEILSQIENSGSIKIFLQIGKTVLSGATDFWDHLGKVNLPRAGAIRILHASKESPYLDERRLRERGSDPRVVKASLAHASEMVEALREKHKSKFDGRQHMEPYVWRLFIFDEVAYAQPYLYLHDNDKESPVLKLSRLLSSEAGHAENTNSLYKVFVKYFDETWDKCKSDRV